MADKKKIVLGSGKLYVLEFTGEIPTSDLIEISENLLGAISGGASLEYKPEFYIAEDDLGTVSKVVMTKEEALLKSGIMTFNGKTLKKICSTARVKEDDETKIREVRIGGIQNQDGKKYLIRFVNHDAEDGDTKITIVGTNQSGFSFAFAKDKETVVDVEFKALPCDDEGTLVIYEETMAA